MSWKQTAQYSFADALLIEHKSLSKLDNVHEIIDWKQIEKTLSHLYASKCGVPAYPPLMMFKILILQAWYNLSDEALEEQIARDLMFRRFIGLSLSDAVPDHSTIWRFRNLLHTENLLDSLLVQINHHLAKNSLNANNFTLMINNFSKEIEKMDFSDVKMKLMDKKESVGWNKNQTNEAEKWYKMFLHLCFIYKDKTIVPIDVIDIFWHQHILDTKKYQLDCNKIFGNFLHHYPYLGMKNDEIKFKNAFLNTKKIFKKHFNLDYSKDIKFFPHVIYSRCGDGEPSKCGSKCGRY